MNEILWSIACDLYRATQRVRAHKTGQYWRTSWTLERAAAWEQDFYRSEARRLFEKA